MFFLIILTKVIFPYFYKEGPVSFTTILLSGLLRDACSTNYHYTRYLLYVFAYRHTDNQCTRMSPDKTVRAMPGTYMIIVVNDKHSLHKI